MASALDSGSRSPGSSLAVDIVLCCWARHCTLSASLHPGVETDTGNILLGNPAMD